MWRTESLRSRRQRATACGSGRQQAAACGSGRMHAVHAVSHVYMNAARSTAYVPAACLARPQFQHSPSHMAEAPLHISALRQFARLQITPRSQTCILTGYSLHRVYTSTQTARSASHLQRTYKDIPVCDNAQATDENSAFVQMLLGLRTINRKCKLLLKTYGVIVCI